MSKKKSTAKFGCGGINDLELKRGHLRTLSKRHTNLVVPSRGEKITLKDSNSYQFTMMNERREVTLDTIQYTQL
jgi:hypothetical protein